MENKMISINEAEYGQRYRFCNPNIPEMFEQIVTMVKFEEPEEDNYEPRIYMISLTGKRNILYWNDTFYRWWVFPKEHWIESHPSCLSHDIKWDEPMLLPIPDSIFN